MNGRRRDGGFDLDELRGLTVRAIKLIGLIEIRIGEEWEHNLQIERDFWIHQRDSLGSIKVEFRPWDIELPRPSGMDELASLINGLVTEAEARPDGSLRIEFADGRTLEVPFGERYEAWHITGPNSTLVSLPGGGLG
jgi:hypothetical protein